MDIHSKLKDFFSHPNSLEAASDGIYGVKVCRFTTGNRYKAAARKRVHRIGAAAKALGMAVCLSFGFTVPEVAAVVVSESDENDDGRIDQWIEDLGDGRIKVTKDRNFDGTVDYAVIVNADGYKEYEELDYNYDGDLDDFYYYRLGVLESHAVDTNYDGEIDLWVYLDEGVYVWKVERDTDFDGKIDYVKQYGPPPPGK